jgi:hypothetical protein
MSPRLLSTAVSLANVTICRLSLVDSIAAATDSHNVLYTGSHFVRDRISTEPRHYFRPLNFEYVAAAIGP